MFRKGLFAVVGVMLVSAALAAQSQPVKIVKTEIAFDAATQMTFRRMVDDSGRGAWRVSSDKAVVVPCKSKALDKKAESTFKSMPVDASGVHVLKQIVVSGTTVQFDFD